MKVLPLTISLSHFLIYTFYLLQFLPWISFLFVKDLSVFVNHLPAAGQLPVDRAGRYAVPPEADREGGPQAVPRRLH